MEILLYLINCINLPLNLLLPIPLLSFFQILAFVKLDQKHMGGHFTVYNQLGVECQRFFLQYFHHTKNYWNAAPYSPYHMSAYSFTADLIYLGPVHGYFYLLPSEKESSFIGQFVQTFAHIPAYTTSHLMKNATKIWLIGGDEVHFAGDDHKTRIIDLEYIHHRWARVGKG